MVPFRLFEQVRKNRAEWRGKCLDQAVIIRDLKRRLRKADGWKAQALALYEIADPDLRDGVLGAIYDIERLEETK